MSGLIRGLGQMVGLAVATQTRAATLTAATFDGMLSASVVDDYSNPG